MEPHHGLLPGSFLKCKKRPPYQIFVRDLVAASHYLSKP